VLYCDSLLFDEHVQAVLKTCSQRMYLMKLLRDQRLSSKELHCIFHALVVSKIRYAMPAWSGFLSAHLVDQINGLLKRAHRYGFTLDVISVEDIAESADSKLFKSITLSNHCLHFLLSPSWIRYTLSALKVKLNYTEDHLFLVIFFIQCIRSLISLIFFVFWFHVFICVLYCVLFLSFYLFALS